MMKNKNLIILFSIMIAMLLIFIPCVQATSNIPLISLNGQNDTNVSSNTENEAGTGNTNTTGNESVPNINTNTGTGTTTNTGNQNNDVANTNLPQTGVAEDTALFVFIAVCIISALYAFIKIRKYKM